MTKYGFCGMGIMGVGMANRLVAAGMDVTVYNRTAAKCEPLVAAGAKSVATAKECIEACDITFACVSDPKAAEALVFGENGVLAGITAGKGYVDMSTVDKGEEIDFLSHMSSFVCTAIATSTKIGAAIVAKGGRFCEAPVSGSKVPAEKGVLLILAAGDQKLAEEAQPAFDQMGKKTWFLGELGQGARMKLVINTIMATMLHTMSEGLAVGTAAGLDGETILEVLQMGAAASPMYGLKGPKVLKDDFAANFPLKHAQKDVRLGLLLGDEVGQAMPTAAAANEGFKRAREEGHGDLDFSAIFKTVAYKRSKSA